MAPMRFVGVDGCPYGWFSVAFDENGEYESRVCRTFDQLVAYYSDANLILVDIPIGLPEINPGRDCDEEARDKIGEYLERTVFPTPTRETVGRVGRLPECCLYATHIQYRFRHREVRGISIQTFGIVHKIAEVDEIVRDRVGNNQLEIREVHPELCFWALKGGECLMTRKKTQEGLNERLDILRGNNVQLGVDAILQDSCSRFPRIDVAKDDILDALVAAVTAYESGGQPQSVPENPQYDPEYNHLRMEMVYWTPPNANP